MGKISLKDGQKIDIDIWDNNQIQKYINAKTRPTEKTGENLHYKDLHFFGPNFVNEGYKENNFYPSEKEISKLEIQNINGQANSDYDRNIVAISNSEIIGISSFLWNKDHYKFWHYYMRFTSVKQSWKNIGVGTSLIKRFNEPCFMWNKIFMLPKIYENEGRKYLLPMINKELCGEHFAIIPPYYLGDTPKKPGIYNLDGKIINNISKIKHVN
ncbi:hypothetical protein KAI32_01530 [Candidatus Pacearchaeota archaeon]|nr:hypothetical protein [Candidatus Pacearchaeota archaeon]